MNKIGKDQTYSRVFNSGEVIKLLRNESLAATEMSSRLSLSNATLSSIIKSLQDVGVIKVDDISSLKGIGRRRVYYGLNDAYGVVLVVNISNYHARISVSDIKQNILSDVDIEIAKYDSKAITDIILECTKLLMEEKIKHTPLRYIVVSLPGRVNIATGELALSCQFDSELFKESHYIQNSFNKQFPNVPVRIVNDINLSALAELKCGQLKEVDNALFVSVDYGIGGGVIYNNQLFHGDSGYSGEFGLYKYFDGKQYDYLDEFISLRVLEEKLLNDSSSKSKKELIKQYRDNDDIKKEVLSSATILGKAIKNIIEMFDISHVVIGGSVVEFGNDYLRNVQNECLTLIDKPTIQFSSLKKDGEVIGGAYLGVDEILNNITKKGENA